MNAKRELEERRRLQSKQQGPAPAQQPERLRREQERTNEIIRQQSANKRNNGVQGG